MKKKVLITVNPSILEERTRTTMRKLLTVLDRQFDLLIVPVGGYDFKSGRVRAFRRQKGGAFENLGTITPAGDLWIVYSDGYFLNHRALGFRLRRDFFQAQIDFHQKHLDAGRIRLMINTPDAEARTLKSWLATLSFRKLKIIQTHIFSSIDEVYDFQKQKRAIVVKPVWGGASTEVSMLTDEAAVRKFHDKLKQCSDRDLGDYCFQAFCRGDEKRLWFIGGQFIAGRKFRGRETPWSDWADDCRLYAYNRHTRNGFAKDLTAARRLCDLSGISVGCIDFIGDRINEINGGGTVLTTLNRGRIFVDTRPAFISYVLKLMKSL